MAANAPRFTPLVQTLPALIPFVGPEAQERSRGAAFTARLGANESVFGPSPKAISAMQKAASETWMYGDPESYDLKTALAAHHGIGFDSLVVGAGIDGLLESLVRLTVTEGDTVVTSDGAYPTFNYHVAGYGGALHKVPFKGNTEDPVALIEKAKEVGAKLIYFCNPDNPMGTWHSAQVVQTMIDALPEGTLLVLDEAYIDTAPAGTAPALDTTATNLIRMRTFSKAYGMAGARVGYAVCAPALASAFNKVRNHFGMSRISQHGALAALADQDYLTNTLGKIATSRDQIAEIARAHGLTPIPSATNFVTMDVGGDGDLARALVAALIARGIFVRMPFVAPQDRCIRVSCGAPHDLEAFAVALPEALKEARAKVG
ncbi:MAG: histidinol-phosphate aminotransferase [Dinoroseobacter sp.]|jgi:histidinol-phosphate aminotransferase